ncbi:MAG: hypothetical protein RLZZ156_1347 [Deinococcota bacterium]|jgi:hypothetical protein
MSQHNVETNTSEYAKFVGAIKLVRIRLANCEIDTAVSILRPKEIETKIEQSNQRNVELLETSGLILFEQKTNLIFLKQSNQNELARISATYELEYHVDSDYPMPENAELFLNTFERYNLPLNAYPFLREFVHNMMGRMNFPILTLPLLQPETPNTDELETQDSAT